MFCSTGGYSRRNLCKMTLIITVFGAIFNDSVFIMRFFSENLLFSCFSGLSLYFHLFHWYIFTSHVEIWWIIFLLHWPEKSKSWLTLLTTGVNDSAAHHIGIFVNLLLVYIWQTIFGLGFRKCHKWRLFDHYWSINHLNGKWWYGFIV